jgi:hypothetical protein
MAFVDSCKNIAISGDFFLTSGFGHSLFANNLLQTFPGGNNALNLIGCFGTLNFANLNKFRENIAFCLHKKILLPLKLVNLSQIGHHIGSQKFFIFRFEVELSHRLPHS